MWQTCAKVKRSISSLANGQVKQGSRCLVKISSAFFHFRTSAKVLFGQKGRVALDNIKII